ncbi:MAG: imidazolonepropionase [Anaerolineae bacterium]|nr:imidazolonepropionase [Anaerolineae bacterium]
MNKHIDLLVHNIGQLCTIPAHDNGPQRGHYLGDLGLLDYAAIAIHDGVIVDIGDNAELRSTYVAANMIDAHGQLVTPGLVDPHTHVIWAGERSDEFEQRIGGATYQEIMAAGGGINHTVRTTRAADLTTLVEQSKARLNAMLAHGSTTVECKTGYGLNTPTEITMLNAIVLLDTEHPVDLVPTFLGAHAIPPEYTADADGYVDLVIDDMLPAVAEWRSEHWPDTLFCDVFCEDGAFDLDQTWRILDAAQNCGMQLKVHADEFEPLGGTKLAAEMGAVSVDHVVVTPDEDIEALAESDTIAVSLPPTPFGLAHTRYTPAQRFLDAGVALAIATDCNPGTGWNENMQFVMALATRYLRLTPAQALAAATVNAAYAVGRGDRVGSLETGKQGDLVIWNAVRYPLLSYRFGTNLAQTVIKRGKVVFNMRWRGMLETQI